MVGGRIYISGHISVVPLCGCIFVSVALFWPLLYLERNGHDVLKEATVMPTTALAQFYTAPHDIAPDMIQDQAVLNYTGQKVQMFGVLLFSNMSNPIIHNKLKRPKSIIFKSSSTISSDMLICSYNALSRYLETNQCLVQGPPLLEINLTNDLHFSKLPQILVIILKTFP